MTAPPKVQSRSDGDVVVVSLDDGKANTFERSTFEALHQALRDAAAGGAGAVLVTGRTGFFSAGLDLKVLPAATREERVETIRAFGTAMLALFTLPRPVVAAVTGHAMGAGAMLALAADVRLGAEGPFRFGLNEVAIGMVVPTFGVEIARAAVPAAQLAQWLLHGRVWDPAALQAQGVLEAVLAPDALLPAALERAQKLASLPSGAYVGTKERLRGEAAARAQARLDEEARTLVLALE